MRGSVTKRLVLGFGLGASKLKVRAEHYQMTNQGLRKLGVIADNSAGNKSSGVALSALGLIASANPVGLVIGTGMKVYEEGSGSIAVQYRLRFEELGLMPSQISAVTLDAKRVTANSPCTVTVVASSQPVPGIVPEATKTEIVDQASGTMTVKTSQASPADYYAVQLISSIHQ